MASGPRSDHRKREERRERLGLEGRRAQLLVAGWPEAMPAWSSLPTTCFSNTQPLSNITTTTTTTTSTTLTHLFDISFLLVLTAPLLYTWGAVKRTQRVYEALSAIQGDPRIKTFSSRLHGGSLKQCQFKSFLLSPVQKLTTPRFHNFL